MHNLFLPIKFTLAGFRLNQTPPACAACTPKQILAEHLQQSQYKPRAACPGKLTRNSALRAWPSSGPRFWPSTILPPRTTVPGQLRVQPAHHPKRAWAASLRYLPSCPSPLPSPQQTLPHAPPLLLQLPPLSAHSFPPEFLSQQEQHGGRQAKAGSEAAGENISLGLLPPYLPGTPPLATSFSQDWARTGLPGTGLACSLLHGHEGLQAPGWGT